MADPRMRDDELAIVLGEIGRALPAPRRRLAPLVRARLERPRPSPWWVTRPLAPALATALLLLATVAVASPEVRAAAREILRLGGIEIFPVATISPPPSPSVPIPGQRTTLDGARRMVDFAIRVPAAPELGGPDEVVVDPSQRVTLVYAARTGLPASHLEGVSALVVEVRGRVDPAFFGKTVGPETKLEQVQIGGATGYWLEGAPHVFFYVDAAGAIQTETLRLAGNTLIWTDGGVTYRLEAQVSKDTALRIATTFR